MRNGSKIHKSYLRKLSLKRKNPVGEHYFAQIILYLHLFKSEETLVAHLMVKITNISVNHQYEFQSSKNNNFNV